MDFNIKDGRRFSVVHGYLLPALERQNLTLLTGTRVDALSFQGSRCTGVRFRIGAEQFEVDADKETALCAGAIESPRLLAGEHGGRGFNRNSVMGAVKSPRRREPRFWPGLP